MSSLLLIASMSFPLEALESNQESLVEINKVSLLSQQVMQEISAELSYQQQALEEKVSAEIRQGIRYSDTIDLLSAMK